MQHFYSHLYRCIYIDSREDYHSLSQYIHQATYLYIVHKEKVFFQYTKMVLKSHASDITCSSSNAERYIHIYR